MLPELDNLLKKELNIEAMLACAFARSSKMMRYIDLLYDSDKERFHVAVHRSKRIHEPCLVPQGYRELERKTRKWFTGRIMSMGYWRRLVEYKRILLIRDA